MILSDESLQGKKEPAKSRQEPSLYFTPMLLAFLWLCKSAEDFLLRNQADVLL
jgi:hypothetical protein